VAINDLTDSKTAHLLKYDSLLGKLDAEVTAGEGGLLLMVNPLPYSVNATRQYSVASV
jgi:glyceraldehyde 3-phosphate dehydrogenase